MYGIFDIASVFIKKYCMYFCLKIVLKDKTIHAEYIINTSIINLHVSVCWSGENAGLNKIQIYYASFIDVYKIKMCNSLFLE